VVLVTIQCTTVKIKGNVEMDSDIVQSNEKNDNSKYIDTLMMEEEGICQVD